MLSPSLLAPAAFPCSLMFSTSKTMRRGPSLATSWDTLSQDTMLHEDAVEGPRRIIFNMENISEHEKAAGAKSEGLTFGPCWDYNASKPVLLCHLEIVFLVLMRLRTSEVRELQAVVSHQGLVIMGGNAAVATALSIAATSCSTLSSPYVSTASVRCACGLISARTASSSSTASPNSKRCLYVLTFRCVSITSFASFTVFTDAGPNVSGQPPRELTVRVVMSRPRRGLHVCVAKTASGNFCQARSFLGFFERTSSIAAFADRTPQLVLVSRTLAPRRL